MTKNLIDELRHLAEVFGPDSVVKAAEQVSSESERKSVCTIVVNEGFHHLPSRLLKGAVYTFSAGPLDLSSEEKLNNQMSSYIEGLVAFLRSRKWSRVFVVISGHAVACMYVKLTVFRVTHLESEDWIFDGQGNYILSDISVKTRARRLSGQSL
jgi:hypothetical protein